MSQASDSTERSEHADTLEKLTDEVRLLREVVDELREELQWAVRNRCQPLAGHLRVDWERSRVQSRDLTAQAVRALHPKHNSSLNDQFGPMAAAEAHRRNFFSASRRAFWEMG